MKKSFIYAAKAALYAIILTGTFAACSNSTSSEEDHHSDPEGIRLKMNGQTVVEQLPGGDITGEFELEPGQETSLITIYFLDDDGDEFQPDEPEYSLNAVFEDDGIAEFEQHAEDGKWSFHLHAEAEGITEMTLQLFHNDHSDFDTKGIHVHVEAPATKQ
ncbi:MAG: hypothetical protein ABJH08_10335 [Balneola sp.]